MALYGTSDAIMCQAFPTTLCGINRGWYNQLALAFVHSFDQLAREFEANFLASTHLKPTATSLLGMSRALLGPTSQAPEEESGESLACRSPTPQHSAQLYPD
ncbi:hypothetical protein BHE74_00034873 [Ensete ventricosum]|nr:hypothetical protein BHE74_00034873 [Ensete ventricosum]